MVPPQQPVRQRPAAAEHHKRAERERSPLIAAAAQGHVSSLRRLLACGHTDVHSATASGGETALHVAAEAGVAPSVQLLLEARARADAANVRGDTPLHCAAWAGDTECMRLLLDSRARVDARGHEGESALRVAATRGHEAAVRCLLDEYDADADARADDGGTPLLAAACNGAPAAVCRILRQRGAATLTADEVAPLRAVRQAGAESAGARAAELTPRLSDAWLARAHALPPWSRRVLVFGDPPERVPAAAVLMEATAGGLATDRLDVWRQIASTFRTADLDQTVLTVRGALAPSACAALRAAVDRNGALHEDTVDLLPNHDWPMSYADLEATVGTAAASGLVGLAERFHTARQPRAGRIFARRYSPSGDDQPWTSFHHDAAHTTVNVALTSDADFDGGDLLGLCAGAVRRLPRSEGDATVHTSSLVHGVTRMTRGVRYSLIIFIPGDPSTSQKYIFPAGSCAARGFF